METVRGIVDKIYFQTQKFCAGVLCTADGDTIRFAGNAFLHMGDRITLEGEWFEHKRYGPQLNIKTVLYDRELDAEGLALWLSYHPDAVGIGIVRARRVADRFGQDFAEALAERPEDVALVAGVSLEAIERLARSWAERAEYNAVATKLAAWELTDHQIRTLLKEFGTGVVRILQENPYVLVHKAEGLGFRKVDAIARKVGFPKDHPGRIHGGIIAALEDALGDGSTCLPLPELYVRADKLLVLDHNAEETICEAVALMQREEKLAKFGPMGWRYLALPWIYAREEWLGRVLCRGAEENLHFQGDWINHRVPHFCTQLNDASQTEAVINALSHSISLIAGGAGAGKTMCIKAITGLCNQRELNIALCAPTGKAARRIEQVVGGKASTIHRLLGYKRNNFDHDAENPLQVDAVIVDEVSMLGVSLAWHLFQAIDLDRTFVVLVGDHHQLPPVEAGALLRDTIARQLVPTTILQKCHRQAGPLKKNCSEILSGIVAPSEPKPADGSAGPWYVKADSDSPAKVMECLRRLWTEVIPGWGYHKLKEVQFMSPVHSGPLGTVAVNRMLQKTHQEKLGVIVSEPEEGKEDRFEYHLGDKVIQTRNNYDLNVMNGHQGIVVSDRPMVVAFDDRHITIPPECLVDIALAYCITPHKMQGSELPCVVTICHRAHAHIPMCGHRYWLYTAATRAQKTCVIVGDKASINRAARVVRENERKTFLSVVSLETTVEKEAAPERPGQP
jgi:exodeoxyribonuclease V alpha subunit